MGRRRRILTFVWILVLSLVMYLISMTFASHLPADLQARLRLLLIAGFLVCALMLRATRPRGDATAVWYALFAASSAMFISWQFSGWGTKLLNLTLDSPEGLAVAKASSVILTVAVILILMKAGGYGRRTMFLRRGRLGLGLLIGVPSFLVLTALAVMQATDSGTTTETLLRMAPWVLIFVFTNAFMEEFLFRGIFLRKLEPYLGRWQSNLLVAIAFTAAHMQVGYTDDLPFFLATLFVLALVWGYVMQKTESLLAPVLFHAGADMLIMTAIFSSYGVAT
ncbi:MAG: CPBP family intramembrane metalloprotease [Candidatus Eisenbacteria sp.]|nr:CPBP family intramembrane metalloprotease [Candidatus Eisenbacteria bacterium]